MRRPPVTDSGLHRDTGQDTARGLLAGTAYFPLDAGWTWSYAATDGGSERRATSGPDIFEGVAVLGISEWQTATDGAGDPYDVSEVYYSANEAGVSIVGSRHADASVAGATDTITYEPPLFYVPADPAAVPTFSTEGSVHLVVSTADEIVQDTTIDWSMAGAASRETITTPAGAFDGYEITYTPGGAVGFAEGVGMVDMGRDRLLLEWTAP